MAVSVKPNGLTDAIIQELKSYQDAVDDAIIEAVDKTASQAQSTLRRISPKLTGDYQKGWRIRLVADKKGRYVKEVYNKTDYQLTHLLEKGHAKTGGGRVNAIVHIAPVEQDASDQIVQLLKEALT
jgi:hypothetical protein